MSSAQNVVTIVQGDYAVSGDPSVVMSTVLGSCVAVCLYDREAGVGGMNHFLLAGTGETRGGDMRYGVNAMELLINQLLRAGAERYRLQGKLFGGARMTAHARDIGQSNATFAQDFLKQEGIPCISHSLGGEQARRVQFTPTTGAARQLQIAGETPDLMVEKKAVVPPSDITLF
ncbi:CheD activator of MCP protein methylation [Yoonia maricola]|uniref:Probable chemoreceptor glutamine deamidase CheD n=1 Tax=Yoonia maricola TaxID=420999 RepID=A0A2M8W202_9RHOB|nr:chemotaxis protein CheD [Yoonia maricola]PJI84940.1 CheD activator of MCP protein methylation [Yoonia maricola]